MAPELIHAWADHEQLQLDVVAATGEMLILTGDAFSNSVRSVYETGQLADAADDQHQHARLKVSA